MGWLAKRRARFAETHPGARKVSGHAGEYDFPYISYDESGAAMLLELCSLLAVVAGMGVAFVLLHDADSPLPVLIYGLCILAVNRAFALLAKAVNNAQVRSRIANNTEYAREFAVKYPAQAHICEELNAGYAANPDAEPEEVTRARITANMNSTTKKMRRLGHALFALFFLMSAALIGFIVWAYRETT
jgi:hypothetical protein